MHILKRFTKMAAVASITGTIMVAGSTAAFGWHATLTTQQECVAEQGIYKDSVKLLNPAEPWNTPNLRLTITDTAGYTFDTTVFKAGEVATGIKQARGDSTATTNIDVKYHWVDVSTGRVIEPQHSSATITHSGTCVPPKSNVDFTASVTCTPVGGPHGTSEFVLHAQQTSPTPPTATFEPADGTKLNSGEPVTVTARWHDEFYGDQSKTVTTEPVAMCTTTPPPPETPKPEQPVVIPPPAVLTSTPVDNCPTSSDTCLAHTGWSSKLLFVGAFALIAGLGICVYLRYDPDKGKQA